MKKNKKKPVLIIAGPGAGKTHDMVDRIMEAIPHLEPYRVLAAITYTNAATANIKERLAKRISVPPNVFIDTCHSFCYRFIFKPFGVLDGKLPKELVFMNLDYDKMVKGKTGTERIIKINYLKKKHLKKGLYGYDEILSVSSKILEENKHARKLLCNRLQYLFIDEFQDANNSQFKIFDTIRKGKKTSIYTVGDPEQYIFRFANTKRSWDYNKIAINKFADKAEVKTNIKNHRSCDEIVSFTNQFHSEIDQESEKGSDANGGVYFIGETDLDSIIQSYRNIAKALNNEDNTVVKYYLSYANKTFEQVADKWGLLPVSNDSTKASRPIDEAIKVISSVVGENGKQIRERYKLDSIGLRKKGFHLVKAVREGTVKSGVDIENFIKNVLEFEITRDDPINNTEDILRKLNSNKATDDVVLESNMYSSIHKAKGLEADTVLVVAENKGQLASWFITEKEKRYAEKTDMCRIGYVAFSRAKTILCIACLKGIDKDIEGDLKRLGVDIV